MLVSIIIIKLIIDLISW